jgi:hypothetical protein
VPPMTALCDQWVCNKNEVSNPATKDDRKQPDAAEKIITTLLWIADVSNKGRIFSNAPGWRERPLFYRPRLSELGYACKGEKVHHPEFSGNLTVSLRQHRSPMRIL